MTREKAVCVIDDDEAERDSLAFLLEADGFVVEAYESTVALIDAGPPTRGSCIVTDVRMLRSLPDMPIPRLQSRRSAAALSIS